MTIYDFFKEEADSWKMKNTIIDINSIIADSGLDRKVFVNEIEYKS